MIDWNDYLHSLCNDYAQWWNTYTLTDVVGQQRIEQKHSPPLLDFMVQTMQSAKEQRSANQEKVERLEVLAGLRKYAAQEHVLLIGRPGSGKSTALARLLLEEAKKPLPQPLPDAERGASPPSLAGKGVGGLGQIPILVELRYYQTSVLDLIRDFLKRHRLLIDTATIEQLLCQGQLLLLVDGINELPSEKARQDLYKFRQDYQKTTPMIFTTRDLGVGGDLGIREKLEMQPLTAEQMQQFVRAYLPAQGEQMLQNLGDRLREFGETPLLLWMLCSLFAQTGDIPPNLGLVFRQFTQSYERQFRQDIPVTDESRRWWLSLLKHLAFYMTTGNKLTELNVAIPRLEAEEVLTQFLQAEKFDKPRDRALAWLQDLLNHHLIQLGANDKIEFRHQLIQEYYTAECLLKLLPSLSDDCLQHDYLNYLKWTEPLALMLALIDDESQAVQVVKLALEVDLRLGARLAGEVKQEFQEKTVELVLGLNISQEIKFYLLGQTGSKQALPALLEAWNNPYYKDFYTIAEALQSVGYDEAMSAILKWEDEWFYELGEAAQYEEEANDNLCEDIVDQLQNISSSNIAVYELVSLLSDKKLVTGEGSSYYFQGRNYKAKQILGETVFNKAIAILLQALNHKDFRVRYQAAFALGNIGSETEVTALIKTVKDENYFVCLSAIDALGKIESLKSVSVLIQALNDEKPVVRSRAAAALGNIGCDQAVFALIKLLGDEKYFVRLKATEALGKIRGDMAISGLIEALKDEDSEVRIIAAQALGNIGSYLSVDPLISALQDEQLLLRSIAMYSLLKIREKLIIESLDNTDCLINFDEIINNFYPFQKQAFRKNAATTLAKICNDCLIYILNDSDLVKKWEYLSIHLNSKYLSNDNLRKIELQYQIWEIIFTKVTYSIGGSFSNAIEIILEIQEQSQFYNYGIFHYAPIEHKQPSDPILDNLKEINRNTRNMSEKPTYDFSGASFTNITGSVTGNIQGDNIGTQNNYSATQKIAELEQVLHQLLEQIEQTKPTPTEAQLIVDQAVEQHPVLKDGQIIEQVIKRYPPLKVRLRKVMTAAGIETVKILFAPAGIVIEAVKAWIEPE